MQKEIIQTDRAPAAVGPYSQAVRLDRLVFVSGQIPIDPASGDLITGDIRLQTRQVLHNLKVLLAAAGSSLDQVLKTTLFITDMQNFAVINEVYAEFFTEHPPARACVEVSALPKGVDIEIEAVAFS